jgi:hypothetical protein
MALEAHWNLIEKVVNDRQDGEVRMVVRQVLTLE